MEAITIDLSRFIREESKQRKPNAFYELCKAAADIYNVTATSKVTAKRFMRDCSKHQKAYELALIDFNELKGNCSNAHERAKLFFGRLKVRKLDI